MSGEASAAKSLALVGASVRAAAHSALRGGYSVQAFDLFADLDLAHHATAVKIDIFDMQLAPLLEQSTATGWMYTGPLENNPLLVHALSQVKPLLGCPAEVLAQVRSPQWLSATLRAASLRFPEIREITPMPTKQPWLRKRYASGGGLGIERFTEAGAATAIASADHYYQKQVPGQPMSAMYLAQENTCQWLATFEQWIGVPWNGARGEFIYCGALGPVGIGPAVAEQLEQAGQVITQAAGVRGLFGIDFMLDDDQITLLEVNPRYTASMELWERATGHSAVDLHCRACENVPLPQLEPYTGPRLFAKAIAYAPQACVIGPAFHALVAEAQGQPWPPMADIPHPGEAIGPGEPVCTLFCQGDDPAALRHEAQRLVEQVHRVLS